MKNLSKRSGVQQGTREGDALVKDKVSRLKTASILVPSTLPFLCISWVFMFLAICLSALENRDMKEGAADEAEVTS